MSMKITVCALAAACAGLMSSDASAASGFPATLLDNGTSFADSVFTGASGTGLDGA